ncbi:MAG: class II aldolase/adducin family protein [Atopobiaceae bacterium]
MGQYDKVPDDEIRRQICEVAHMMAVRDMANGFEGNISVRKGDRVFETPSQTSKELLRPEQVVVVSTEGDLLEGAGRPTSETPMHLNCYDLRDDVFSVVHCHAPYCTAYAQAEEDFSDKASAECQVMFGRVPCLSYGTQGTLDIIAELPAHVDDHDVFLLAHHGVLAVGISPLQAFDRILALENLIRTQAIRRTLFEGRDCDLPESELETLAGLHARMRG